MIAQKDHAICFEQYFTKSYVARDSVQHIVKDLNNFKKKTQFHFIEPSCGNGVFVKELKRINSSVKVTSLDIDHLYTEAIIGDFLKTDKKVLNIKLNETTVFLGCPPSYLTQEFLQRCQMIEENSIIYFLLEENKLKECIKNGVIVFSSILKNYGHNAFFFKSNDFTTQCPYLLTRVIFAPNVYNEFLDNTAE